MAERDVVVCVLGPCCGGSDENLSSVYPYGPDHHGWDCPLSDPLGDTIRTLMDPSPNPILEQARRSILARWGVQVEDQ